MNIINSKMKKEVKKLNKILKNSTLNWLLDADCVDVFPLNRGEFNISFQWEGGEFPTGEEYGPTWSNYYCLFRNGQVRIEKRGGTCYVTPCDPGYEKTWVFDKRGKLLWESPSEEKNIRRRPCRK